MDVNSSIYCVYVSNNFSDNYNAIYCDKFFETKDSYLLVPSACESDRFTSSIRLLKSQGFVCDFMKVPISEILYWNPHLAKSIMTLNFDKIILKTTII